jgi:hypothetical protein
MKDVLSKFSGNFIVASFIPALAFISLSMIVFEPIIPDALLTKIQNNLNPFGEGGIFLLTATIVLGFTLHNLNTFIYKIFEGYYAFIRPPFGKKLQEIKYKKLNSKLEKSKIKIDYLEKERGIYQQLTRRFQESASKIERELNSEPVQAHKWKCERLKSLLNKIREQIQDIQIKIQENKESLEKHRNERYSILSEMQLRFPNRKKNFLPTSFGNILKAAEAYPGDRYGIDAVRLWPRLVHVIPETYYEKVEQSNDGLAFLVNCSVSRFAII